MGPQPQRSALCPSPHSSPGGPSITPTAIITSCPALSRHLEGVRLPSVGSAPPSAPAPCCGGTQESWPGSRHLVHPPGVPPGGTLWSPDTFLALQPHGLFTSSLSGAPLSAALRSWPRPLLSGSLRNHPVTGLFSAQVLGSLQTQLSPSDPLNPCCGAQAAAPCIPPLPALQKFPAPSVLLCFVLVQGLPASGPLHGMWPLAPAPQTPSDRPFSVPELPHSSPIVLCPPVFVTVGWPCDFSEAVVGVCVAGR